MNPPVELIVYSDPCSTKGSEWSDSPETEAPWKIYIVGWVTAEAQDYITVHSSIGDPNREATYGHDTAIPKGCIVKREVLKEHWQ